MRTTNAKRDDVNGEKRNDFENIKRKKNGEKS